MENLTGETNKAFADGNFQGPPPYQNHQISGVQLEEGRHAYLPGQDYQSLQPATQLCYVVPVDGFYVVPKFVLFHVKATRGIAITQIVLGCLVLVFDLVASVFGSIDKPLGVSFYTGVYSGIIFILAGAFGLTAARQKSRCYLITSMIFSIISCAFVILCLTFLGIQINDNNDFWYYVNGHRMHYKNRVIISLSAVALVASAVEGIIAIVQASFACVDCCPCCKTSQFQKRCRAGQAQRHAMINVQGAMPAAPVQQHPLVILQQQGAYSTTQATSINNAAGYNQVAVHSGNVNNGPLTISFMANNNNNKGHAYPNYPFQQYQEN